tara:strand:+ start:13591 stop:14415 length:825 start_codon:yes stop_codon:yes gene_type:complete
MLPITTILGMSLALGSPQSMEVGNGGGERTLMLDRSETRIGRARLSLMRADGVELAWIEGIVAVPDFNGRELLPDVIRFEAPWLDENTGTTEGVGQDVRFEIDRGTVLRDGGISGDRAMIQGDDGLMRLASLAAGEGEYDIYDLTMSWDAYRPGPLTLSVIGGLKAIDARIGKVVDENGTATFRDARGLVAVPIIGGGVSWRVSEDMIVTGMASTQTFEGQGSMLDLSAETSIRLGPNVGLNAGYQFIRSAVEVQSLDANLDSDGVFARIQIRF